MFYRRRHRKNVLTDYHIFDDEDVIHNNASEVTPKSIRMENPRQSK